MISLAAALLAAAPASAATTASGSSSVTADVANTLEATFPGNYAWGSLTPGASGATSTEQVTTVKSNALWGVKVSTDLTDGRMKEWDGAAYVLLTPKLLTNPLTWSLTSLGGAAQSNAYAAFTGTAALVTGSQAVTGDSGTAVGITLKQVVSYADQNAGANDYRVQVNYTAQQGF